MDKLLKFNNKLIKLGNKIVCKKDVDPLNPLGLPPNTIRVKLPTGVVPTAGDTQTLVDANENVWDIYKQSNDWSNLFNKQSTINHYVISVLGANTENITNMYQMFKRSNLNSTVLFNTSSVTNMGRMFELTYIMECPLYDTSNVSGFGAMFENCISLKKIPQLNVSKATDLNLMFNGCSYVEEGILDFYNRASILDPLPAHNGTFLRCGKNTVNGRAEWLQVPDSWTSNHLE